MVEAEEAQAEATSDESISRAAERLSDLVTRIESVEEEIGGLKADRADIYAEAKAAGFEVSILRAIVRRRRMDKEAREEADELLRLYEDALEGGAT
jgi:uncharacterized protein (UPF0335 family)